MLSRQRILGTTLGITMFAASVAILGERSLAKPIRRPLLADKPPLQDVINMMVQRENPDTHMRRLSAGALPEFDLNRDGRISELEQARAVAMIREQQASLSWYGNVFNELSDLPSTVLHTILPRDAEDGSESGP